MWDKCPFLFANHTSLGGKGEKTLVGYIILERKRKKEEKGDGRKRKRGELRGQRGNSGAKRKKEKPS